MVDLDKLVAATRELRALPATTMQLLELLDDVTVGADRVLAIIEKDPALTANLLKLCNSAFYGVRRRVGSVKEGLVLLGNQTVISLAFATSMGDVMRGPLRAYNLEQGDLWRHAVCAALGASGIARRRVPGLPAERAFTAGLLHDIGKLLLDRPLLEMGGGPLSAVGYEQTILAERDLLGFDHAEAGAALAEAWNFPAELVQIIREHHLAQPGPGPLSGGQVITLANHLSRFTGHPGGATVLDEEGLAGELQPWRLSPADVRDLLEEIPQLMEQMAGVARPDE